MPTEPASAETPGTEPCPCGSGAGFGECCGPRLDGSSPAPSAEALMRSRYTAFVRGDGAYLLDTWHPSTRPDQIELDPALEWRRLRIVEATDDGPGRATVAFVAHLFDARHGEYDRHAERSSFRRVRDRWTYVDGVPLD